MIAIEREGKVIAVDSMVIIRLHYSEKMNNLIVPENAKQNSGDYYGEVISVGPEYLDKSLKKGDKLIYLRNEGYKFTTFETREELYAVKSCWIYGRYV